MLIFDEVFVKRAGRELFRPISFALQPGKIMTLQGESGLGKSTLLHALIDQEPGVEFKGQITLDGKRMDAETRLSAESQTVFQEPLLFPHYWKNHSLISTTDTTTIRVSSSYLKIYIICTI